MDDPRQDAEEAGLHGPAPFAAAAAVGELPLGFAPLRLILRPGGTAVEIGRPDVVVGRHSFADVRLPLPDVSRRHCRLFFRGGCWHVQDLKSLNGTLLNGEPVRELPIRPGDTLRVGGFTFEVELVVAPRRAEEKLLSISRALPDPAPVPPRRRAC